MEKLVKDGKVAVLVSPGFGAGWSSWSSGEIAEHLLFDTRIIEAFQNGGGEAAAAKVEELWPGEYICTLGAPDLSLEWVDEGSLFYLHEYDGNEWLVFEDEMRRA